MKNNFFIIELLIISLIWVANCARILVVLPTPSYSHNVVYRTIYKELSLRGHELVVFTPDPLNDPTLKSVKEIDLSYFYKHAVDAPYEHFFKDYRINVVDGIQNVLLQISREIFLHTEMKRLVNDSKERFDLLLVEWNVNPSFSVLSKRFDCPMIGMRSLGLRLEGHDSVGNPTNPSYIPIGWMDFEENFWGRLDNFLFSIVWRLHYHLFVVPKAQKIADEFLPEYSKNILEIEKNVSIVLTNTHPILTGVRPLVPAIIEIGGIHLRKEKRPIPKDVQEYLDSAKEGIVYFSLGSNVKSSNLDQAILKVIISSLSELPYKVIWKWEKADLPNPPLNVKIWNWLPQEAILGHPNVKAFVTHGGLLSIMEAVDNHVPMVGIPFFADQHVNVRKLVKLKIGKRLDVEYFKKRTFVAAVKKVIQNPSYKKNIKKVEDILHDLPMKPLDKAIWWIEYVLRHKGARHLRSPAVDIDWFTYLLLDVILLFIIGFLILIFVIYYILKFLWLALMSKKGGKVKVN